MISGHQVPPQIKWFLNSSMRGHEAPGLPYRLELVHSSLPDSGCLMRLLYPIVGAPTSDMVCFRDYLTMAEIEAIVEPHGVTDDM